MRLRPLGLDDEEIGTLSDAGVYEGGPVKGLRELATDLQFRVTQGERGGLSSAKMCVE